MSARTFAPARPASAPAIPRGILGRLLGLRRQRHRLAELDDRMLDDIGIAPEEARREASRPVWDVPQGWLR